MAKPFKPLPFLFFIIFSFLVPTSLPLPLSTNNRWIVDSVTRERVKLACVNWPSHLETMLAEGLHMQPLPRIVSSVVRNGFNCVRFTFATHMFTRFANRTVAQSFDGLNLTEAKAGIAHYNPSLLGLTLVQAHQAVVDEMGAQGLMVDLDNHVSRPSWCCSAHDGNGFFGDKFFDPREWLEGLKIVAKLYRDKPQVVAMGLRNELRGPRQNARDWYYYMKKAATEVHKANPNVLLFIGGLKYANDLTFLKQKPLGSTFGNKLVYEAHWYPWSWEKQTVWTEKPLNHLCPWKLNYFINQTAFMNTLDRNPVPIFVGEVGTDQRGLNRSGDYFWSCFLSWAAGMDMDWGLWGLQGNYYLRDKNKTNAEETFGVLDYYWGRVKNPYLQNRLGLIKSKVQDPTSTHRTSYLMFHPQTGSCMQAAGDREIYAGDCKASNISRWIHDGDGSPIRLQNRSHLCLEAAGDLQRVKFTTNCNSPHSTWTRISNSKLLLAAKDQNGDYLCLHKESRYTNSIFTRRCMCLGDRGDGEDGCLEIDSDDPEKDPTSQWFQLVETNV
ncbi:unnamed protein product [Linum trigynum]|uniref:Glycoside hydrolase family 5 domain-containing protein n=1 Tax=Linum trigynum TaxID=586398 RepID=A0AAV2DPF9_9ROSI